MPTARPRIVDQPGSTVGTIAYMSPSSTRRRVGCAHDPVFVRAVLYEMATGRMAFPGNTAAVVMMRF